MQETNDIYIKPNEYGMYAINLHNKCIYCNAPSTKRYNKKFHLTKEPTRVGNTIIGPKLETSPELAFPYCEKHYEKNIKLKKLNRLLMLLIFLLPGALIFLFIILFNTFNLFENYDNVSSIAVMIIAVASAAGLILLRNKIFYKDNQYGELLGVMSFGFSRYGNSLCLSISNKEYADDFVKNNPNVEKYIPKDK